MKKATFFFSLLFISTLIFSQSTKQERANAISNSIENVLENLSEISAENTSLINQQPDAYIGKLFPSLPPHFSVGVSVTGTMIGTRWLGDAAQKIIDSLGNSIESSGITDFKMDFDVPSKLPLPTLGAAGRIGGFFLPFDIGVFGFTTTPNMLQDLKMGSFESDLSYSTFGADLRYAVYEGNILFPKISIGGGYIFSRYDIGLNGSFSKSGSYTVPGQETIDGTINVNSKFNMTLDTHSIFAQIQASKKLLIFTPYIGFRSMFTCIRSNYDWNYDSFVFANNTSYEIEKNGNSTSFNKDFAFENIQPQIFGGIDLKLALFQLALNASWNLRSNYFTAGLMLNLKL